MKNLNNQLFKIIFLIIICLNYQCKEDKKRSLEEDINNLLTDFAEVSLMPFGYPTEEIAKHFALNRLYIENFDEFKIDSLGNFFVSKDKVKRKIDEYFTAIELKSKDSIISFKPINIEMRVFAKLTTIEEIKENIYNVKYDIFSVARDWYGSPKESPEKWQKDNPTNFPRLVNHYKATIAGGKVIRIEID